MSRPQYLFKFKSIDTAIDLCRFEQILCDNVIFLPNKEMLNDPLESMTYRITLCHAGGSYITDHGHEDSYVTEAKNQYRILSLSRSIHSPLMWAHYANNYTGACLIFSGDKTFSKAKKVKYTNQARYLDEGDFEEIDDVALDSLFEKMKDWSYEKEWRYIEKEKPGLIHFNREELVGVVVGHNMPQEIRKTISERCEEWSIPCFCTSVLLYDSKIIFFPENMGKAEFEFWSMRDRIREEYSSEVFDLFAKLNKKQMKKWERMLR